ncbi:MAG: GNAT family N-acetyltransferase [Asticcacaulis sp.]
MGLAEVVPHGFVARLCKGDELVGLLPFQRRGRTIQPFGAPLTDYCGIISLLPLDYEPEHLLRWLDADVLEFQGWIGRGHEERRGFIRNTSQVADLSDGYEAYFTTQKEAHHKFFKNVGRCSRNLEKDLQGLTFRFGTVTEDVLEWVLEHKRDQYQRTGMHDVFSCGWTRDVLLSLARSDAPDLGLRVGQYLHEGRRVAAEICLLNGKTLHLWFPAYAPQYARYSPGILLTLSILKHVADLGVTAVDFGCGGEGYKHTMTSPGREFLEGGLVRAPKPDALRQILTTVAPQHLDRYDSVRLGLRRRMAVIRACEVDLSGKLNAYQSLIRRALQRLKPEATRA